MLLHKTCTNSEAVTRMILCHITKVSNKPGIPHFNSWEYLVDSCINMGKTLTYIF